MSSKSVHREKSGTILVIVAKYMLTSDEVAGNS